MSTAPTKKKAFKDIKQEIVVYLSVIVILILTTLNINKHFTEPKVNLVLGAETEITKEDFWREFLSANSYYIPGWVELGRLDKANQIDPNYFLQ